jgi:hypothetical protein
MQALFRHRILPLGVIVLAGCMSESPLGFFGDSDTDARERGSVGDAAQTEQVGSDVPCGAECPDFDRDGRVDLSDLAIVLANVGRPAGSLTEPCADMDSSGTVDAADVMAIAAVFGQACGTSPSPRPGTPTATLDIGSDVSIGFGSAPKR